jgi:hypothetical protein
MLNNNSGGEIIPDMFAPMTEREVENFESEMQPCNFEKPAEEIDIHESVKRVSENFNHFFE